MCIKARNCIIITVEFTFKRGGGKAAYGNPRSPTLGYGRAIISNAAIVIKKVTRVNVNISHQLTADCIVASINGCRKSKKLVSRAYFIIIVAVGIPKGYLSTGINGNAYILRHRTCTNTEGCNHTHHQGKH